MLPIIHKKLRKDKIKNGKCPVILQIYYQKDRKQTFTGLSIEPEFWDEEKQEANKLHKDRDFFNRMLKNKLEATEKEFFKQSALLGTVDIHEKQKQSRQNFYDYAILYYDSMTNRASDHYIKKCKAAIRDFRNFSGNLNFQSITPEVLKTFEDNLFELGRARNTINFVFKKLKQVFAHANKEKVTDHNSFNIYKAVTYKQTVRHFLTMDEIVVLESSDFGKLNYIRDYFCISCRTGLRFGDMKKFDKSKDIIRINGVDRIIIGTEKTGEPITIKVMPNVRKLLDGITKPLPSNKHTNELLKIIGEKSNLKLPLNYHKSRHSFAVNSRSFGIPTDAIQRLLGHKDIRTTMIYSKIVDTQLDGYMDKWG